MTEARKRVGLPFGGRSAEHEVSKLSAANVLRALKTRDWDQALGTSTVWRYAVAAPG